MKTKQNKKNSQVASPDPSIFSPNLPAISSLGPFTRSLFSSYTLLNVARKKTKQNKQTNKNVARSTNLLLLEFFLDFLAKSRFSLVCFFNLSCYFR